MRTGRVRSFIPDDIPAVSRLHHRVFHTAPEWTAALDAAYEAYFTRIFFNHPWQTDGLSFSFITPTGGVWPRFEGAWTRVCSTRCDATRAFCSIAATG